ncbi:hypothetical protein HK100_007905, partial [Physocladia obscura]
VSPSGRFVAGGGESGRVFVWHVASGRLLRLADAHFKRVVRLAWTPDGQALASAADDAFAHVHLLAAVASAPSATVSHALPLVDLAFSPLATYAKTCLFTASKDRTVKIWDPASGACLASILFPRALSCLAVDPLLMLVYAGAVDHNIYMARLYKSESNNNNTISPLVEADMITVSDSLNQDSIFKAHLGPITSVALSFDAKFLVSGSQDGAVIVWDAPTRQQIRTYHMSPATAAAYAKSQSSSASSTTSSTPTVVPPIAQIIPILRPREELSSSTPAFVSTPSTIAVWKRFLATPDEIAQDLASSFGGGEFNSAAGAAQLSSWSDLDSSVSDLDADNLVDFPTGYNPKLWDSPDEIATRFSKLEASLANNDNDNSQSEIAQLRLQIEKLTEHNQSLRKMNDDIYNASSKNAAESLRNRKKSKTLK